MRYGFDFFSLNEANKELVKYDQSNILHEHHHDYNNSCVKYTVRISKCDYIHHVECSGLYCNNHDYHNVCTLGVSTKKEQLNVAVKSYKSEIGNEDSYWLLDGGASMHITPYLSDFSEYREYQIPIKVKTANKNAEAEILGEGKIYIQNQIGDIKREMMIETCYMPNGQGRLFSTGSLKKSGFIESSDINNTKLYLNGKLEII
jgi:hypothetical protein